MLQKLTGLSVKISLQLGNNVITTFIILSLFNCITNTYN